eukprot:TRINITY_DN706_c0_g1_i2.p1 TRINITY_DN706_c0_g1~~TRINITY_DN706_c0_g1_i2.p1  ORF type:complete len:213 (-),score=47.48 TRINITY_DN706_c0_g1_i2:177-815(-)
MRAEWKAKLEEWQQEKEEFDQHRDEQAEVERKEAQRLLEMQEIEFEKEILSTKIKREEVTLRFTKVENRSIEHETRYKQSQVRATKIETSLEKANTRLQDIQETVDNVSYQFEKRGIQLDLNDEDIDEELDKLTAVEDQANETILQLQNEIEDLVKQKRALAMTSAAEIERMKSAQQQAEDKITALTIQETMKNEKQKGVTRQRSIRKEKRD